MERLFIQLSDEKLAFMTSFVVQGHIYDKKHIYKCTAIIILNNCMLYFILKNVFYLYTFFGSKEFKQPLMYTEII